MILGLGEDREKTTIQVTKNFFNDSLKIKNLDVHSASRLGVQSDSDRGYARPIIVSFNKLPHRNKVCRKRHAIPNKDTDPIIRIQADLPRALREGIQTLYRIVNAASKIDSFAETRVQDYQLVVNGEVYQITDLESLPKQLRPSTLASPKSDSHLAFFSKYLMLSNHHPSKFKVEEQDFNSMEHFLAVKRAELSGNEGLIQKAMQVNDPVQAKYILNKLHHDHQEQWENNLEELVMSGLGAKFGQNSHLRDYLCSTGNLILG